MGTQFFYHLDLSAFDLNHSNLQILDQRSIVVTKWLWSYELAHKFQKFCVSFLQTHPRLRILICCSHPETLTNGRGLQKPRKGEALDLIDFNPENYKNLPYPFYQIERGGGLTFHHPGQFIFYPILKLNPTRLTLSGMINQLFDFSIDVLAGWGMRNLSHENKLLGLWAGPQKIASMGLAIERLTTFHGMAINIYKNENMKLALKDLNPCGLSSGLYTSAQELGSLPDHAQIEFRSKFLERIESEWK